jgi:hypothetical protein
MPLRRQFLNRRARLADMSKVAFRGAKGDDDAPPVIAHGYLGTWLARSIMFDVRLESAAATCGPVGPRSERWGEQAAGATCPSGLDPVFMRRV